MSKRDIEPTSERQLARVRRPGLGHLAEGLLTQQAWTVRAQVRGQTMVYLADVLGSTATGAEVSVQESDGARWSMTVWPGLVGQEDAAT